MTHPGVHEALDHRSFAEGALTRLLRCARCLACENERKRERRQAQRQA